MSNGPSEPLLSISIVGFEPKTAANKSVEHKIELRDELKKQIVEVDKVRERCKGKNLSLDICFNLFDGINEGRSNKDLDNLLKVLLDTLPDHMDTDKKEAGLGLISNDRVVFHIQCRKKIISEQSNEGIDLKIFEYKE